MECSGRYVGRWMGRCTEKEGKDSIRTLSMNRVGTLFFFVVDENVENRIDEKEGEKLACERYSRA